MRPALVLFAAAIALFLLVKGVPYVIVRAESLATSIVFSQAWDHARGGMGALGPRGSRPAAAAELPETPEDGSAADGWQLTSARPVARLSAPRLGSTAVIVGEERPGPGGIVDFLLVAPSVSFHQELVPPPDAVTSADGGAPERLMAGSDAAAGANPLADGAAAAIHASMHPPMYSRGVSDTVIIDKAGRSLRFLPDLRPGDELELEGVDGQVYVYKVTGSRVALSLKADDLVNPDLIDGRPELTLVAPYPLNDLTPSAFRYVVRADLVDLAQR